MERFLAPITTGTCPFLTGVHRRTRLSSISNKAGSSIRSSSHQDRPVALPCSHGRPHRPIEQFQTASLGDGDTDPRPSPDLGSSHCWLRWPEPLLIVEPNLDAFVQGESPETFIDRIWPAVEEGNSIAPAYAKIRRSRVIVAVPEKPFVRAPKGTVVRRLTTQAYKAEMDAVYSEEFSNDTKSHGTTTAGILYSFLMPGLKQFVRKHVRDHLTGNMVSDNDNIFLKEMDSLGAAAMSRSLQKDLAFQKGLRNASRTAASLRMIYTNPTVEKLAHMIFQVITNREDLDRTVDRDMKNIERALDQFTQALPQVRAHTASQRRSAYIGQRINVALLGPRGSLGPNILRELLESPRVDKIYCLNRGVDAKERMSALDFSIPKSAMQCRRRALDLHAH